MLASLSHFIHSHHRLYCFVFREVGLLFASLLLSVRFIYFKARLAASMVPYVVSLRDSAPHSPIVYLFHAFVFFLFLFVLF